MEIIIKNQLGGTVDLCAGMKEYRIKHGAEIIAEVEDGDYMYLDQVVFQKKPAQTPAEKTVSEIIEAMDQYKSGKLTRLETLSKIGIAVSKYFDDEIPIPYQLTDKAEVHSNDQSPA